MESQTPESQSATLKRAARERIHDGSKTCRVCGQPYEHTLRVTFDEPPSCVHDALAKVPNADRKEIARMAERAIKAETQPI